jgi:nucleoside-diphosphate-sugar epimerase
MREQAVRGESVVDRWQGADVVVGGGCGFIGSYVVLQLVAAGARVTVADNLENGRLESLSDVRERVEFVECDLRDRASCERLVMGRDVVINMAARAFGQTYSQSHHGEMLVQNLLCTLVPLEASRAAGVRQHVIVSSSCVHPDDAPIPTPELNVFTGLPEHVNAGYGWAKRIQELAGTYYAVDYGMDITVVRPFNVYGANYPWRTLTKAHVIPTLVKRVLDGEDPIVVRGSGKQRRNFLHGRDAARLLLKVIQKNPGPEPVNLGFEDDTPIATLIELICDVADVHPTIVFDSGVPEGQFRKSADATRLREITGEQGPTIPLREGIREMVEWYRREFGAVRHGVRPG